MIRKLFLNDRFILVLIIINAILIFISGFEYSTVIKSRILMFDSIITVLFLLEVLFKVKEFGFKSYFRVKWNVFDFVLVFLAVPSLVTYAFSLDFIDLSVLLVLRILRVFKFLRFIKFIPGLRELILGITRALKTTILIMIGFAVYIFIVGVFSHYLFKDLYPACFGNPLISLYSVFKIFTIEGWFEIPETLSEGLSQTYTFFIYLYFIFIVITGGIFGLSLVNSIFVEAMLSDNNDELEKKVDDINNKLEILITKLNTK